MIDPRAGLAAFRASTLAATRDNGTPTGPGIEADVDMVAQDYGWPSAIELMAFLTDGPETARLPQ